MEDAVALEYPIIVGAGQLTNRSVDAQTAKEPLELMELASRRAEADAGGGALLAKVDSVQVVNVLAWPSADPPADLAARLNAQPSETFYTTIGGNTPQSLVNDTAERI
ncbi:MAG: acetyl-CoA acetyltransferase, partial [Chloroflexi bacterium]|nr:acetyl-CoA acetyltransferase [Chloroflexota bacterium]